MVWKIKQKHTPKKGETVNILLYYLLTLGFCYFQISVYSIILSSLHIFFHLKIYGNSFQSRSKNSLCYQGDKNQCWLPTYI